MAELTVLDVDQAISATWPAGRVWQIGSVKLRDDGSGQRATAATVDERLKHDDLVAAEKAMVHRGQSLFRVQNDQRHLDEFLAGHSYLSHDETVMLAMPAADLATRPLKPVSAFCIWPPLAIMHELWKASGIGRKRLETMSRVDRPKTGILGRGNDQPGGVGFVALDKKIALVHAVAVSEHLRRQKIARNMMVAAAKWSLDMGADWFSALCVKANVAALTFYGSLGMSVIGSYHYRARKMDQGESKRDRDDQG